VAIQIYGVVLRLHKIKIDVKLAKHIPELDSLRAVAILAVLVEHSLVYSGVEPLARIAAHGWMGVDLFFVLSGFLITGILLDSNGLPHYFRNFYLRRALRIWPLYYTTLLTVFFILPRVSTIFSFSHLRYPLHVYAFYLQNLLIQGSIPGTLAVTWSLAIEEQFYIFWPPLVRLLSFERVRTLLIACLCCSPLVRLLLVWRGAPPWFDYTFTFARLDAIAMGALAAWWVRSPSFTNKRLRLGSKLLVGLFGLPLLSLPIFIRAGGTLTSPQYSGLHLVPLYSVVAIGCTGLLGMALATNSSFTILGAVFRNSVLRYIGKISYSLYLFHFPVYLICKPWIHSLALLLLVEHLILLSLSSASWYFFERPILSLKSHFDNRMEQVDLAGSRIRVMA
jgi:peptidoglycan/LPS O-acetylase OafA/YrhL